MSFGTSIGDAFAIIGAIERIANEVRAYQSAPLHFQRLAIELGSLSSVCRQVFDLRPSLSDELLHIERIRAIAMQCLGPLQDFQTKMEKYENTLGTHRDCIRGKRRKVESIKGFGKQLHWSAIARHDVDELRAILTSEILAINTLLGMMKWSSLESQNFVNRTYLTKLRTLIQTTNDASTEIKRYLVDCKLVSEKLESLIMSGNMTQRQQTRILKTIENKTSDTQKAVLDLSRWHRQHTFGVREAIDDVSTQIVKLFSFKGHIEDWIRQIAENSNNTWGISKSSMKLSIPIPPPEEARLQGSSWTGSWTSIPMRKDTRRVPTFPRKRRLEMLYSEEVDVSSPVTTDNDIEKMFQRVHVIPFQGDPLEALIKIGQRCRDLIVMFFPGSHQSLSSPEFQDTFSSILADLEEIRNSGITPMAELGTRRRSAVEHAILQTYFQKTATIIKDAPLGDSFSKEDIHKLVTWSNREPEKSSQWLRPSGDSYLPSFPDTLAPDSFHTLHFHKYPISSAEEIKLEFSSARRVGHGQRVPIYGRGREEIDWLAVATKAIILEH
ncbi:hypothetical protein GQX73_g6298 [Xylaria multiplex]|uniref:Fungal N-terminal domain-containing protein n=1 Tax=Xylaria multiplex TaxID=323545 RepID=A0A7C8MKQ3_9PEZI|nr:hypothetical protein GQX73_g6298 [Xylaria multiplex]